MIINQETCLTWKRLGRVNTNCIEYQRNVYKSGKHLVKFVKP